MLAPVAVLMPAEKSPELWGSAESRCTPPSGHLQNGEARTPLERLNYNCVHPAVFLCLLPIKVRVPKAESVRLRWAL